MNLSNTDSIVENASSQVPSEFFCLFNSTYNSLWDVSETTTFKITAAITLLVSPVSILLNILVILAVRLSGNLKEHKSNILLASLVVTNVLIGAISMPLTIGSDVLVILKQFSGRDAFCRITFANQTVLNIGYTSSLYHLVLIAWERYVAIRKWKDYKSIVTRERLKKYASIAWLIAVLKTIPLRFVRLTGVQYKYLTIISTVSFLPGFVCLILIVYFYIMVYLGVRKRNVEKISDVRSIMKAKLASKVAKTTAILTVAVLVSFVPSFILVFLRDAFSAPRRSSYFRWSLMMVHLNSLFNPLLYCCRDSRYKDVMLEMLKMKKSATGVRKNGHSLEDLQANHNKPTLRSCSSLTNLKETDQRSTHDQVKRGGDISEPSRETICVDIHQPKISTRLGIQVKSRTKTKPTQCYLEDIDKYHASTFQASLQPFSSRLSPKESSHHHLKKAQRQSLDGVFEMNGSHHKPWKEAIRRRERVLSTRSNKKIPDGYLSNGFTREPGNKKRGVTTIGTRSHQEDIRERSHVSKTQALVMPQWSSLQAKDSQRHYCEMVRTKSLNERALFDMMGSQHKSQQEATGRPKTELSNTQRNKKIPQSGTRKPAIKIISGVTRTGRRSHRLDTSDPFQASRFKPSHRPPFLSPRPRGPKGSLDQFREMMTSKSLNKRPSVGKIGIQEKSWQEAIKRPNTAPLRRNMKKPEPNLTHGPPFLRPIAKGPAGSRHHCPEMMTPKSLEDQMLVRKIVIQHRSRRKVVRKPKTVLSTTRNKMPERKLTDFTRKPGIKVTSGKTSNGRRSQHKVTRNQLQASRLHLSLQSKGYWHRHGEMIGSTSLNEHTLLGVISSQHKYH